MNYNSFLKSRTKDKWQRIGIHKRSGIAVPLFSIYSKSSTGIGEIPDLKIFIDWCKATGFSIIQLLPLYDTGFDFSPYSAVSSFAIDPMYIRTSELRNIDVEKYSDDISSLKSKFSNKKKLVDYRIKKEKLTLLWKIFNENGNIKNKSIEDFKNKNIYWINDYALFKVYSEINNSSCWENWKENEKLYDTGYLAGNSIVNKKHLDFHIWIQWQLFEQLKDVKKYASHNGILLMGDTPFLVSRNSADVWSHKNYFKLNRSAGAPPDMYFAYGQRWGMPPYSWKNIENDNYVYLKEKLKYAENFFDLYRVDHFVGLFRIWTVDSGSSLKNGVVEGKFDPAYEKEWEKHGRKIIDAMLQSTSMLPCAEDLGTVPDCSYFTLRKYSIPGTNFQRFMKDNYDFVDPHRYRPNSITTVSTHDSSFLINWWHYEAGSIDEKLFELICKKNRINNKFIKTSKLKLFNKHLSGHGRLFWKRSISSKIISTLFKETPAALNEVIHLYNDSFDEKKKYKKYLNIKANRKIRKTEFIYRSLEKANDSNSIFSIQSLQEYLCLNSSLLKKFNKWNYRINTPGTIGGKNWSIKLPFTIEKLKKLKINGLIYELNKKSGRIVL